MGGSVREQRTVPGWEHFHHVADIGVRGYGHSPAEAFEQAALSLSAVSVDLDRIIPRTCIEIRCTAPDYELLLVDWLNALIYEMAVRSMIFARFAVRLSDQNLNGQAWGERVEVARHAPAVEVKGATYTALQVAEEGGVWVAQCVVDV